MLNKTYNNQVTNASARAAVGNIYAINTIISGVTLQLDKVEAMGECDEYRIDGSSGFRARNRAFEYNEIATLDEILIITLTFKCKENERSR